ncbi:hypothetical protein [Leptospira biflexa]|nr:hypothetical protein [Leptospira biflexa]
MLQSLQPESKEETTWAVISMAGEVLAQGAHHPQIDRTSDSLFTF